MGKEWFAGLSLPQEAQPIFSIWPTPRKKVEFINFGSERLQGFRSCFCLVPIIPTWIYVSALRWCDKPYSFIDVAYPVLTVEFHKQISWYFQYWVHHNNIPMLFLILALSRGKKIGVSFLSFEKNGIEKNIHHISHSFQIIHVLSIFI